MLLRSLSSLSENRLSWSAEVPLKNPVEIQFSEYGRKDNCHFLPASAIVVASCSVQKFYSSHGIEGCRDGV